MSFGSDLEQFEVKTVIKGREALQKISMDLFKSVILMSPVGNPDLWKHPVRGYVGGRFKATGRRVSTARRAVFLTTKTPRGKRTKAVRQSAK